MARGADRSTNGVVVVLGVLGAVLAAVLVPLATAPPAAADTPAELAQVKARLDEMALQRGGAPGAVTAWWVDATTRSVVLALNGTPHSGAESTFVDDARALGPEVRVVGGMAALAPRADPVFDLVGGDAIQLGGGRCSVGFSARTLTGAARMITAGHCTTRGGDVQGANGSVIGPVRSAVFDRTGDWGVVDVGPGWRTTPTVASDGATTVTVTGTATAPVGAPVCRSGSTSGRHCGTVTATDVTANYATGPVTGLVLTTACSEGGDSGGPFVSGSSAVGTLSGGSGDCSAPGATSLYQPIDEILRVEGLSLVTG